MFCSVKGKRNSVFRLYFSQTCFDMLFGSLRSSPIHPLLFAPAVMITQNPTRFLVVIIESPHIITSVEHGPDDLAHVSAKICLVPLEHSSGMHPVLPTSAPLESMTHPRSRTKVWQTLQPLCRADMASGSTFCQRY